jgi:hypothetical protein
VTPFQVPDDRQSSDPGSGQVRGSRRGRGRPAVRAIGSPDPSDASRSPDDFGRSGRPRTHRRAPNQVEGLREPMVRGGSSPLIRGGRPKSEPSRGSGPDLSAPCAREGAAIRFKAASSERLHPTDRRLATSSARASRWATSWFDRSPVSSRLRTGEGMTGPGRRSATRQATQMLTAKHEAHLARPTAPAAHTGGELDQRFPPGHPSNARRVGPRPRPGRRAAAPTLPLVTQTRAMDLSRARRPRGPTRPRDR